MNKIFLFNYFAFDLFHMKTCLLIFFGISLGLWFSWPGIFLPKNWKCFNEIISKSADKKISLKATLAVSPNYFLKGRNKIISSRIRVVSDACFR